MTVRLCDIEPLDFIWAWISILADAFVAPISSSVRIMEHFALNAHEKCVEQQHMLTEPLVLVLVFYNYRYMIITNGSKYCILYWNVRNIFKSS